MKIKYLDQYWHYKPEYWIDDFVRVNCLEDYDPRKIVKMMVKLYAYWCNEQRPEYYNVYDSENINEVLEPNQI